MIKKLSKYIAAFDCFDKTLIVLSATGGRISIISFASIIKVLVGIASASFSLAFSLTTGIIKKKKHNKIVMLAKSKLNSIKALISQALIDLKISHEKLKTIVNEKEKHEKMKEIIRITKSNSQKKGRQKNKTTKL